KAMVLLAKLLSKIGDTYKIYAFSSEYGKDNTFIYPIKDSLDSKLDMDLLEKIVGGLQAMHANRDGAAIRWTTKKILEEVSDDKERYLIILSDGEPWHDGTEYVDKYALEDTKKAIEEAREKGIKVIYILVYYSDTAWGKELGSKADAYFLITDVKELPKKMLGIIRKLKRR
ncbi:VWA domain-containing protein, partial [Candidatus Woesearchaeota archaeon]|nr:VWA domain-containing protein [Candidatus Woesearchaeota archaeon]